MTRETYWNRAEENLRAMSRTARGILDTSASMDKKDKMAVTDGETAKDLAVRNFADAFDLAWESRYRVIGEAAELRAFIEKIAETINRGLLREGLLYRNGADSAIFNYTPVAKVEASASWFYEHLFSLLCRETYDAVEAAATAEYYINLTVHFFADGCSKCAMSVAAWLLMRVGHPLPVYPGGGRYFEICKRFRGASAGSECDREDFDIFLRYYRTLFAEDASCESANQMTLILPRKIDFGNFGKVEAQIDTLLQTVWPETIRMDAGELELISSAGLRMLARLINEYKDLVIFNTSETVYEALAVSGFTSLMRVDRRPEEITRMASS